MKINIIRQNALKYKRTQRIRQINSLVTLGSLTLFGLSVLWVSGQYVYYAVKSNSLTSEVTQLKNLYSGRADVVASYLATKQTIASVTEIQGKRFKYREFLDAIFNLIPPSATLSEVSFGVKGIILVGVRLPGLNDYDTLMANLDRVAQGPDFLFDLVAQRSMTREKTGGYLVTMELTIK